MDSPLVDAKGKQRLRRRYAKLNPAELQRKMLECQDRLYKQAVFKGKEMDTEAKHKDKDLEYIPL